jgi:UDP-N-acetylmuramate--alanine ligase
MSPRKVHKIHFVGIGGTGMCGLAEVCLNLGYEVTGSDLSRSEVTDRLELLGARIHEGHEADLVREVDLVVFSSAIRPTNPEYEEAVRLGKPMLRRGEMLAEIMRLKSGIAIAGSHGKTSTTSLIGHLLASAGLDPTVVVGGRLRAIGSNARLGAGIYLVAEADESDGSFLDLDPTIAVVTNIDLEHLDHYRGLVDIQEAFLRFLRRVPFYGVSIVCGDDPNVREVIRRVSKRTLTYGFSPENNVVASEPQMEGLRTRFTVGYLDEPPVEVELNLPGRHNASNALACFAVAREVGISVATIAEAMKNFGGVGRRFEIRSEVGGVLHVDDYGHHPTEVAAVLATARAVWDRRVVTLFQPHRFSRTQALHEQFGEALAGTDILMLTEIYPAGERPLPHVSSSLILAAVRRQASPPEVVMVADADDAVRTARDLLRPGDVLLTLGAGDVYRWGDQVMNARARDLATAGREKEGDRSGSAGKPGPRGEGTTIE